LQRHPALILLTSPCLPSSSHTPPSMMPNVFIVPLFTLLLLPPTFGSTMKSVLDLMEMNATMKSYGKEKWKVLEEAMGSISADIEAHFDLQNSMDKMFDGFVQWGISNGTDGKEYPQPTPDDEVNHGGSDFWDGMANYQEHFLSPMAHDDSLVPGASNVLIQQPCNYASNVAYYSSMLSIWKGDGKEDHDWSITQSVRNLLAASFGSLGSGSAFFHGSGTQLGCRIDNAPIAHIALTAYQAAVSSLERDDVVVNVLPEDKMVNGTKNGTTVINEFVNIFADQSIFEWDESILTLNKDFQGDYKSTFAAIVTLNARLELPTRVGDLLLKFLCEVFGFNQDMTDFLFNEYDVRLQSLVKEKPELSGKDKRELLKRGIGVLVKIGYAMAWQEELFVGPWLASPGANKVGAWAMPFVNILADKLTSYSHDFAVKTGYEIYPDCKRCRAQEPHSKWHEQSAVGLTDLVYLTDDIDYVLRGGALVEDVPSVGESVDDGMTNVIKLLEEFLAGPEAECMRRGFANGGLECVADLWGVQGVLRGGVEECKEKDHGFENCFFTKLLNNNGESKLIDQCAQRDFEVTAFISCANNVVRGIVGRETSFFAIMENLL